MTHSKQKLRAILLATLMVLSVFAGTVSVASGASTSTSSTDASSAATTPIEQDSAKPITISWFRDDGDGNGPYPVLPNEYEDDTTGIQLFGNAEGDAHLSVDSSLARNPNGQWDMLALHLEIDESDLQDLEPPADGADKGLVTQNFLDSADWDVSITQANGDKVLNLEDNLEGYDQPPVSAETEADIPPVMVFADTDEVDDDFATSPDPDTGIIVWIDPNRAVLDDNGADAGFETGEQYDVEFSVKGETDATSFETVEGDVFFDGELEPPNKVGAELAGESTLASGTEVQLVLELENGETQTETVEVEGNEKVMGTDNPATVPAGPVSGLFDLSGQEGQTFTLTAYAPGPEGGLLAGGEPARDDDDYLAEENRIQVAQTTGTVQDVIDPDYTIESAEVGDGKPLSLPYGIDDYESAAVFGDQVGDGEVAYDDTVAKDVQGTGAWDGLMLHYETSDDIFEAIDRSPGNNIHEKFENSPLSLEVVQANADGDPKTLDLSRNASGTLILPDEGHADSRLYQGDGDTGLFVWLDLNEVVLFQGDEAVRAEPGEVYEATLTIETEQGDEQETIEFAAIEGNTWFAGENGDGVVELRQSETAEIRVITELAAGFEWTIEAKNDDGLDVSSADHENHGDGDVLAGKIPGSTPRSSMVLEVDTSDLEYDTELTLSAILQEDPPNSPVLVEETTAVIVPPPTASVSFSDQSGDGETITIDEVDVGDGGFVAVHTDGASGPTIGYSDYLESGTHEDVEISLNEPVEEDATLTVVVHEDGNANEAFDYPLDDDPYTADGENVVASADYTVEASTDDGDDGDDGTANDGDENDNSDESDDEPADDDSDENTDESTDDGSPGFGVVAALIALLATGFARHRRD